ncbi:arrestin domain-containing protein 17 [Aplysia californica]|uniref:Arrestin domain-containing protein 17 n=1 Tax=Aplysia californica TaxID=6500 RepID=A0ABM0JER4_APLCA|nr:arrestin domain-containing protein 17 [Aplysia californica]
MARVLCFAILTNDRRSVCWAGGVLEGKVTLDISTPLPVRGVRMTFYGEGRVEWAEGSPVPHMNRLAKQRRKAWKNVRTIADTEIYSKTTTILYGADPESTYMHVLPAGNHCMPFELPVPSDLPSSYEGCHGYVRYWLECVLDVIGHVEQITKKAFTVISKYNLNTDPIAEKEIKRREEVSVCCGCGAPGFFDIRYFVSRHGYVPGEKMMVDIRTRNFTNSIVHLFLRFKTTTTYHAKGKQVKVDKKLHEGEKTLESAESLKWNPEIPVPPLPPTGLGGSRVIDVRYWLEVEMYSDASFTDSIHFVDEIRIGTLPLDHVTTALPVTQQPGGKSTRSGLLPIGYPTPEVRALPAPGPAVVPRNDVLNWTPSDGTSGGSANRVHAYNGHVVHHSLSTSSNSLAW